MMLAHAVPCPISSPREAVGLGGVPHELEPAADLVGRQVDGVDPGAEPCEQLRVLHVDAAVDHTDDERRIARLEAERLLDTHHPMGVSAVGRTTHPRGRKRGDAEVVRSHRLDHRQVAEVGHQREQARGWVHVEAEGTGDAGLHLHVVPEIAVTRDPGRGKRAGHQHRGRVPPHREIERPTIDANGRLGTAAADPQVVRDVRGVLPRGEAKQESTPHRGAGGLGLPRPIGGAVHHQADPTS